MPAAFADGAARLRLGSDDEHWKPTCSPPTYPAHESRRLVRDGKEDAVPIGTNSQVTDRCHCSKPEPVPSTVRRSKTVAELCCEFDYLTHILQTVWPGCGKTSEQSGQPKPPIVSLLASTTIAAAGLPPPFVERECIFGERAAIGSNNWRLIRLWQIFTTDGLLPVFVA